VIHLKDLKPGLKIKVKMKNLIKLRDKKMILFGASNYGKNFYEELRKYNIDILGFCDNDKKKWSTLLCEKKVFAPEKIIDTEFDLIIITSMYAKEIYKQLIDLGISKKQIAIVNETVKTKNFIHQIKLKMKKNKPLLYNEMMSKYYKCTSPFKGRGISSQAKIDNDVIITLTSIPSRIDKIWLCIESLLRQSYKPNKIILWLSTEEFQNRELPKSLIKQQKRGLEIRFCENYKSHKKYYYTMKEYPQSIIVTVDDDIFYGKNMLKELVMTHIKNPKYIVCHRAHRITFEDNGKIKPYREWDWKSPGFMGPSHLLLQVGCSGVLYPPKSLHEAVFLSNKFMKLCPKGDDLWLKVMGMLNGTKIIKVRPDSTTYTEINGTQEDSLWLYNVNQGGNDEQFKNLITEFRIDNTSFLK
jgi:hypothetical protein